MQATKQSTRTRARKLTKAENAEVYEMMKSVSESSIPTWIANGEAREDVDFTIGNVIGDLQLKEAYQKMRDPLMKKYGLTEREFVGQVLMASSVDRPSLARNRT